MPMQAEKHEMVSQKRATQATEKMYHFQPYPSAKNHNAGEERDKTAGRWQMREINKTHPARLQKIGEYIVQQAKEFFVHNSS